jgi:hypothetical protein
VCDVRAIQHIFAQHYIYVKPPIWRYMLGQIVGNGMFSHLGVISSYSLAPPPGLLVAEGQQVLALRSTALLNVLNL